MHPHISVNKMNRTKIIIIGLAISIILFIFIIVSFFNNPAINPNNSTDLPQPTSTEFKQGELYITSINPQDTSITYLPAQPIEITFTMPVSPSSITYTTNPITETFTTTGSTPNSITVSPKTIWTVGATQINITSAVSASNRKLLLNPQRYILKTAIPTIPNTLEGAY